VTQRVPSSQRNRTRILAASGLAVLLVGSGAVVVSALDDDTVTEAEPTATRPTTPTPTRPRPPEVVRLRVTAIGAYDPEGDGRESDERAPLAVDGDVTTSWATERYDSFFKQGVGLVLDVGSARRLQRLDLVTATPGYAAEIRGGTSPDGPFGPIGPERTVDRLTQFPLGGKRARYVLVWVTDLPDGSAAEVAEARVWARRAR
jgi:hypothetical protein